MWLEENRAERSFPCGVVPDPEPEPGKPRVPVPRLNVPRRGMTWVQVIAAVLPSDLAFIRGEETGEIVDVGRIPRRVIREVDVVDAFDVPIPGADPRDVRATSTGAVGPHRDERRCGRRGPVRVPVTVDGLAGRTGARRPRSSSRARRIAAPPRAGEELFRAIAASGSEVELVTYPREGHVPVGGGTRSTRSPERRPGSTDTSVRSYGWS